MKIPLRSGQFLTINLKMKGEDFDESKSRN